MHPTWQDMARDEVRGVCGSHDIPTKDCVSKLKTLTMILNESLRLYPPIVASIRRAKADVELGGYKIPRGTELLIPILAVHHDQTIWGKDANEFNPRRFSDGVARAGKHPLAFIPFGLGVRTCIGQNLAMLQAKLTIAMILQSWSGRFANAQTESEVSKQRTKVAVKRGVWSSRRRLRIQDVSATAFATPRYSASTLDRDNVSWRFEDHVRRLSPKKTQYPEIDRRVAGQPAQLASKAWNGDLWIGEEVVTYRLYLGLAFIVLTLKRVTLRCCEVGGGGGGSGGGVIGGVGVVCSDGVDSGGVVRGFVCGVVKASISMMIVSVLEKDRWRGTRGKFVQWKVIRVTKASKHAKVGVRVLRPNTREEDEFEEERTYYAINSTYHAFRFAIF
nr:cytochrome P450 734A1-like [Tanacetum cinerariifolium]